MQKARCLSAFILVASPLAQGTVDKKVSRNTSTPSLTRSPCRGAAESETEVFEPVFETEAFNICDTTIRTLKSLGGNQSKQLLLTAVGQILQVAVALARSSEDLKLTPSFLDILANFKLDGLSDTVLVTTTIIAQWDALSLRKPDTVRVSDSEVRTWSYRTSLSHAGTRFKPTLHL